MWFRAIMTLIGAGFAATAPAVAADASAGSEIVLQGGSAGATACVACHGVEGAGNAAAGFPRLAGLDADYLLQQLEAYHAGTRTSPVMAPIAKALTDAEQAKVSEYYALQEIDTAAAEITPDVLKQGRELALTGDWENKIPACVSCHGPQGLGVDANFPRLAGQHASYIMSQIQAWKDGTRQNDSLNLMKVVAERLTAEQAKAVAAYFASQRGDE